MHEEPNYFDVNGIRITKVCMKVSHKESLANFHLQNGEVFGMIT